MFALSLPIAASLAPIMPGAAALPEGTAYEVSLDRADALAALGTAVSASEGGRVSFTIEQAAISNRPISASCSVKSGRVASGDPAMRKQPRAIVCRFSETGRWLPVRLELQSCADRGGDSNGSNAMRGELSFEGHKVAVMPLKADSTPDHTTPNRYLFTMSKKPAASVEIGEESSVRTFDTIDEPARQAILLAAAAMTVLSPAV